jgi:uncharacterized damage-inducible protein DinB
VNEIEVLRGALDSQREHVLGAVDGLTDEQLTQPILPSHWNCVGLINHLALDVERFWFRQVFAGEELTPAEIAESGNDAWLVPADAAPRTILERYRQEIARADAIIGSASVEDPPAAWPDLFAPQFHLDNLRELLVHVITETACHAGHLDATRELIDGRQWLVLTE